MFSQQEIDNAIERNIVIGMIVSDSYLKEVSLVINVKLFTTSYITTVATWCLDYYSKYQKSPKEIIQEIFDHYNRNGLDSTQALLIIEFLDRLSDEYDTTTFNEKYMIDQAINYFRQRSLENLSSDIKILASNNQLEQAEALLSNFKRITKSETKATSVFTDRKATKSSLNLEQEFLFQLPGTWGQLVKPFVRGDFMGIFAPAGRGKSFMLMEMALQSAFAGFPSLFVSLEMTEAQLRRRINLCLAEETLFPTIIKIPILDCVYNQIAECSRLDREGKNKTSVEKKIPAHHIPCTKCRDEPKSKFAPIVYYINKETKGLTYSKAIKTGEEKYKQCNGGDLRLACFPGSSITMSGFNAFLDNLSYFENYSPVFIYTDYADFFGYDTKTQDRRIQIDEIWRAHRSIAQTRNCVVVTISHTNSETFDRDIKQGDASENRAKMNHVTKAASLNQTMKEKDECKIRTSMIKQRDEFYSTREEVVILQQLAMSKFYLNSYLLPLHYVEVKEGKRPRKKKEKELVE